MPTEWRCLCAHTKRRPLCLFSKGISLPRFLLKHRHFHENFDCSVNLYHCLLLLSFLIFRDLFAMSTVPDIIVTDVRKAVPKVWTPRMEEKLFASLVEMIRAGKRAESGYKKEAWTHCVTKIKEVMDDESLRPLLDIKKCKSKVDINKQRYREFCFLLQKSGWGFDKETQRFDASPEMWDKHIKVSEHF